VRGNGKIIQELEAIFTRRRLERDQGRCGARDWDALLATRLRRRCCVDRMDETVDGECQKYMAEIGRVHPQALLRQRDPRAREAGRAT
jgi:pyruvate dehydrogenase complex dehydrogenase (E1) component